MKSFELSQFYMQDEHGALPLASIRHLMRRAVGGDEQAVVSNEASVAAVQQCTSEFLSFVVSEARIRVAKEGRTTVTYPDMVGALTSLGFKQFLEPVKVHMNLNYHGEGLTRKRPASCLESGSKGVAGVGGCGCSSVSPSASSASVGRPSVSALLASSTSVVAASSGGGGGGGSDDGGGAASCAESDIACAPPPQLEPSAPVPLPEPDASALSSPML